MAQFIIGKKGNKTFNTKLVKNVNGEKYKMKEKSTKNIKINLKEKTITGKNVNETEIVMMIQKQIIHLF